MVCSCIAGAKAGIGLSDICENRRGYVLFLFFLTLALSKY